MVKLNFEEADWIKGQPTVYQNGNSNILIGNMIPAGFEAYCKILHPFTIFGDMPAILIPDAKLKRCTKLDVNCQTGKFLVDGIEWTEDELVVRRRNGEGTPISWSE